MQPRHRAQASHGSGVQHSSCLAPQYRGPQPVSLTTLTAVLRGLLAENVPLKEFRRIAAAIAVAAQKTLDADELLDWHYDYELGSALAVRFFRDVDLGPDFVAGVGRGQVSFADYKCAGPDR